MLWAALILGALVVISCTSILGLIASRSLQNAQNVSREFVQAHTATLNSLERTHERNVEQINSVLDRFMALDFSLFKAYQSSEQAEAGGFVEPEDEDEGSVVAFTGSGRTINVGADVAESLRQRLEEDALLREDFSEEFWQREDAK
jgi:chromosome condensin MukBEF ATPase and DNA-binding subunit MukB